MKIIELKLLTSNLAQTKKFYAQILGFRFLWESETEVACAVGSSILIFKQTEAHLNPKYHFAFNIPNNKIYEAQKWLQKRTSLIKNDNSFITNFENWNAKSVYFLDNNQNILELISRTDLKNPSDTAFSIGSFLNINEIGLVTDNPLREADEIIKKMGIPYFLKGPKRKDFCVLGDDKGLFVISDSTRSWYPTNEIAEKWKVSAKINVHNKIYPFEY